MQKDGVESADVSAANASAPEPAQEQPSTSTSSLWGFVGSLKQKSTRLLDSAKQEIAEFGSSLRNETKDNSIKNIILESGDGGTEDPQPPGGKPLPTASSGAQAGVQSQGKGKPQPKSADWNSSLTEGLEGLEKIGTRLWDTLLPGVFGMRGPDGEQVGPGLTPVTTPKPSRVEEKGEKSAYSASVRLHALQAARSTYLSDSTPETGSQDYEKFQQSFDSVFDSESWPKEVVVLLRNESVRKFYDELVPNEVAEKQFWCRYKFRVHQLEQEELRRKTLVNRLTEQSSKVTSESGLDLSWDDGVSATAADTTAASSATAAPALVSSAPVAAVPPPQAAPVATPARATAAAAVRPVTPARVATAVTIPTALPTVTVTAATGTPVTHSTTDKDSVVPSNSSLRPQETDVHSDTRSDKSDKSDKSSSSRGSWVELESDQTDPAEKKDKSATKSGAAGTAKPSAKGVKSQISEEEGWDVWE